MRLQRLGPCALLLIAFTGATACSRSSGPQPVGGSPWEAGCNPACCSPDARPGTCWPLLTEEDDLHWTARLREVIDARIRPAAGDRVADIGAGMGWFTKVLAERVGPDGRVFATDIDPRAIRHLRDRQPVQVEPRLVPGPTDTGLDDVPSGSLSLMLMINAVTVVDSGAGPTDPPRSNDVAYLARLARTLAPGGRFLYHQDWLEQSNPDRDEAIALFARAGLGDVVEVPMPDDMPGQVCMCFTGEPRPRKRGYVLEFTRTGAADGRQVPGPASARDGRDNSDPAAQRRR